MEFQVTKITTSTQIIGISAETPEEAKAAVADGKGGSLISSDESSRMTVQPRGGTPLPQQQQQPGMPMSMRRSGP